jgi:putative hydroxymethylpyrimidine transport system ATP-binding protein
MVTHDPREALRLGHRILVMTGQPAALSAIAPPSAAPPRPLDSPEQFALEGEIIRRLAA